MRPTTYNLQPTTSRGYTLIELIIAVGLFALVMLLASGAYIMMIGLSRQAQGIATGINNLSFALETMTRDIRTGTNYNCGGLGDCSSGASVFSFKNESGVTVSY
ncbi:MAG: prepilin-type N-terminal cleavage/methylation domain-containing protein, partial [Candidatus Paceibacterota bacterium]